MSDFSYDYSVLIIGESDFLRYCNDVDVYMGKLDKYLLTRAGDSNLRKVSVTGKFNIPGIEINLEVDDRNKTAFIKSLDDHLNQFNEVVIITNFERDYYLEALTSRLDELSKSFTVYGYETKGHEKS
jgi:hypothetical protein